MKLAHVPTVSGVYVIVNKTAGKHYIGSASDMRARPKVRGHYSAAHGAAISAGKKRAFAARRANA